jgi:uncharacterized protein YdaU (DUF1376 family)
MAKDPAFLFYPNDWIGGTMGMTFEEKGAYMELLMMQFNRGHMTSHMIGQVVGQVWDKVKHKFIQDDKKLWFNERLDIEINKRKNFTKSRRNNILGNNQYTKNKENESGHMTSHMENENENENIDINKNKGNYFKKEEITILPENYIISSIQQIKIQKQKTITVNQVNDLWEVFKSQYLTGEQYYHSENKVYLHFVNWIKNQKFETNGKPTTAEDKFNAYKEYANRYS